MRIVYDIMGRIFYWKLQFIGFVRKGMAGLKKIVRSDLFNTLSNDFVIVVLALTCIAAFLGILMLFGWFGQIIGVDMSEPF